MARLRGREALFGEALADAVELEIDDGGDLFALEAVEDDDLVDAVEELGAEVAAQGFCHLVRAAHQNFGPDSPLYRSLGFVPRSERKRPKPRKKESTPPAAPAEPAEDAGTV